MAKKSIPTHAELEKIDQLRELSRVTRIPQQEFLREGLDHVLTKYRRHLKKTKR